MSVIKCKNCGKEFIKTPKFQAYCSEECREQYFQRTCDYCGQTFTASDCQIKGLASGKTKHIYCSKECANKAQITRVTKTCEYCGTSFTIDKYWEDTSRFCSRECFNKFNEEKTMQVCKWCGKTYKRTYKDQKFCSKPCAAKSLQKRIHTTCDYCGKEFDMVVNAYQKATKHYCSNACRIQDKKWSEEDLEILWRSSYQATHGRDTLGLYSKDYDLAAIQRQAQAIGIAVSFHWSEDEIAVMYQYYSKIPTKEIMKMLPNRSYQSIIHKGQLLNIPSYTARKYYFTPQQKDYVYQHYLNMSDKDIGKEIGKEPEAVARYRHAHAWSRPRESNCYADIAMYLRHNNREWAIQKRAEINFTCALSGARQHLVIHHTYSFNLILNDVIEYLNFDIKSDFQDYSHDELQTLLDTFRSFQDELNQWVCITDNIHNDFHKQYGYGDNTPDQWEEFVKQYKSNAA